MLRDLIEQIVNLPLYITGLAVPPASGKVEGVETSLKPTQDLVLNKNLKLSWGLSKASLKWKTQSVKRLYEF